MKRMKTMSPLDSDEAVSCVLSRRCLLYHLVGLKTASQSMIVAIFRISSHEVNQAPPVVGVLCFCMGGLLVWSSPSSMGSRFLPSV
jgi:hypothetical protein